MMKSTQWIAAVVLCCGAATADAGLFDCFKKGAGCGETDCCPTCAAPEECCEAPTCCAPACCAPAECCPNPNCAAPSCCAPAEPGCCAPSCCAPAECCPAECAPSHCHGKKKSCLSGLFDCFKKKDRGCCEADCCPPTCAAPEECCPPACSAPCGNCH